MHASTRARLLVAAGVAAIAALQLLPWLFWSTQELAAHGLFRDDGFFYAVIADNHARLGFLTFDGELPTNGVQPLWMWMLIAAKSVWPTVAASTLLARMSFVTYVGFAFVGALFAFRGAVRAAAVGCAVFAAGVVLNPAFQFFAVRGLETPLLLLLLMAYLLRIDALEARRPVSSLDAAGLALLGALCFFARTQLFWLSAAGLLALLAWQGPWRGAPQGSRSRAPILVYIALTAALVLPYLAFNVAAFGSPMPISGRVKRFYLAEVHPGFADYVSSLEWHGVFSAFAESVWVGFRPDMGLWALAVLSVLLPLLVLAIRQLPGHLGASPESDERRLPASLSLLALACAANLSLMYGWYRELRPYTSYYFASEFVFVVATIGWLLRRVQHARAVVLACAALIVISSAGRFARFGEDDYWSAHLAVIDDVRALPANAAVGAYWPGALGALAGRPILPLDGIISSPAYFEEYVRRERDLDWLLARESPHLAIYLHRSPESLLDSDAPPDIPRWNRLGELRLWSRRDCGPRVVARHPRFSDGTGWYLFSFDREALERCRETHGIGRYSTTSAGASSLAFPSASPSKSPSTSSSTSPST